MAYGRVDRSERHLAQPVLDFEIPIARLTDQTNQLFTLGKAFFKQNWVEAPSNLTDRDGLGPLFNANSCNACHLRDGRGRPESGGGPGAGLLFKLGIPKSADGSNAEPYYGTQFQDQAVPGEKPEGKLRIQYEMIHGEYADGEGFELRRPFYRFEELSLGAMHKDVMVSPRVANHIIGMGLLESIPEQTLLKLADLEDRDGDGISGRAHRVIDRIKGTEVMGRFGWKAGAPSVLQQTAAAFVNDMGITSNLFPVEPLSENQAHLHSASNGGRPEISDEHLEAVAAYSSLLAVPPRRNIHDAVVERGERLFSTMNCIACHVSRLETDDHPKFHELTSREIEPFTDLLLHDMGDELADGRPDGQATGVEWRTPPLWGIGLFEKINGHTYLLHDGRARNFAESILWHGGEAAASRESFRNAAKEDRLALLKFLESL